MQAEELALADCCRGVDVRRTWAETEMVRAIDGSIFPGTPDGMFESWDGTLTCVQVVRVPLTAELSVASMQAVLAQTVVTKVVKSQQWLRASHTVPHDFIIFCWLPFGVEDAVAAHAETLMQQIRELDPRFSLRLRVPPEPGALFPARFASYHCERQKKHGYSWSDVATYGGSDEESEGEDEPLEWDITWSWGFDWRDAEPLDFQAPAHGLELAAAPPGGSACEACEGGSDLAEVDWDFAFGFDSDWAAEFAAHDSGLEAPAFPTGVG